MFLLLFFEKKDAHTPSLSLSHSYITFFAKMNWPLLLHFRFKVKIFFSGFEMKQERGRGRERERNMMCSVCITFLIYFFLWWLLPRWRESAATRERMRERKIEREGRESKRLFVDRISNFGFFLPSLSLSLSLSHSIFHFFSQDTICKLDLITQFSFSFPLSLPLFLKIYSNIRFFMKFTVPSPVVIQWILT